MSEWFDNLESADWFNYEEIDRRNGWLTDEDKALDANMENMRKAEKALFDLMDWIGGNGPAQDRTIGTRASVVQYVLSRDGNLTLEDIGRKHGVTKQAIGLMVKRFRKKFNVRDSKRQPGKRWLDGFC